MFVNFDSKLKNQTNQKISNFVSDLSRCTVCQFSFMILTGNKVPILHDRTTGAHTHSRKTILMLYPNTG